MDDLIVSITDFIRVRQLNIALAGVLSFCYFLYQYWDFLFKNSKIEELEVRGRRSSRRLSQSRSRSPSRSRSRTRQPSHHNCKPLDTKHSRRGRKSTRRCTECSHCFSEPS